MSRTFTPESCRAQWMNVLHPARSVEFTEEEDKKLKELAEKHNCKNWKAIAEEMGVSREGRGEWSGSGCLELLTVVHCLSQFFSFL